MPIFFKNNKKVFFIHIPKCGGTSIEKFLAAASGNIEFFSHDKHKLSPCTPQHIDRTLIHSFFFQGTNDFQYMAIFRHPLMRIISEYFHANRNLNKPFTFDQWVVRILKKAKHNKYIRDNHLRNQVDFLVENATVFHFDNGLNKPIIFSLNALDISIPINNIPHERKYKKYNITISKKSMQLINDFYKKDFEFFGYGMVNTNEALGIEDIKNLNLISELTDGYTVLQRCKQTDLNTKFDNEFKYGIQPTQNKLHRIKKRLKSALTK